MLKALGVWMVIGLIHLQGGAIVLLDTFADREAAQSEKNRAETYLKKISPKATEEFLVRRYDTEWILMMKLASEDVQSMEEVILPLAHHYPKLLVTRSNGKVLEKKEKMSSAEGEASGVSQTALLAGIAGVILLMLVWFAVRIRRLGNIRNAVGKMEKRFEDIRRRLDEQ